MSIETGCNGKAVIVTKDNGERWLFSYDVPIMVWDGTSSKPRIYEYARESDFTQTTRRHMRWFIASCGFEFQIDGKRLIDEFLGKGKRRNA